MGESENTVFGRAMRDVHFLFAPTYTPLNHGSYGSYPKHVQRRFHECQALSEARPDAFVRYECPEMLDRSRASIASFLGLAVDEVVLIQNSTTGVNVVLRSMKFEEGDVVVHLSTVYGAVEKTVEYLREMTPVDSINVEIECPIDDEVLVANFEAAIVGAQEDGKKVRLAVFDTVSSMPGVRVPWERLVHVCKEKRVLSMVDGAHSVGQIELRLAKVQPDFFVSNLHKWLFTPRGSAVFYVPKRNQHLIRSSLPTSHGFDPLPRGPNQKQIVNPLPEGGKSGFVRLFEFVATADVSPYLCIEEALRFRREVCGGEAKIMKYCEEISTQAGIRAAEIFGTEVMENKEKSLTKCAFVNVKLPLKMGTGRNEVREQDALKAVRWIALALVRDYDAYASVFFHAKSFWVRFSGQIYLEIEDFDKGTKALKTLCERVQAGEHL